MPRPNSIVYMKLEGKNGDSGDRRILGEGNTFEFDKVMTKSNSPQYNNIT